MPNQGHFPLDGKLTEKLERGVLDTLRKNLKARMDELGMNPTSTAAKADVGESAVRDILRGKARSPGVELLAKIAKALDTTIDALLGNASLPIPTDVRRIAAPVQELPVIGRVSASHWWEVEDADRPLEEWGTVPSVSGYPIDWQFGMIVEGNCLNKLAKHGDRLVCLDAIKSGYTLKDDDLLVIERSRYGGHMLQRTAKRLRQIGQEFELWPESDDPAHQEPLRLSHPPEGEEVRVYAKVLWILKSP
ncbi:MAG: phage repressor [Mesorhizobium amorphae]|nr:MAG: phage repressor [Mesorhizobium amorphae]